MIKVTINVDNESVEPWELDNFLEYLDNTGFTEIVEEVNV